MIGPESGVRIAVPNVSRVVSDLAREPQAGGEWKLLCIRITCNFYPATQSHGEAVFPCSFCASVWHILVNWRERNLCKSRTLTLISVSRHLNKSRSMVLMTLMKHILSNLNITTLNLVFPDGKSLHKKRKLPPLGWLPEAPDSLIPCSYKNINCHHALLFTFQYYVLLPNAESVEYSDLDSGEAPLLRSLPLGD